MTKQASNDEGLIEVEGEETGAQEHGRFVRQQATNIGLGLVTGLVGGLMGIGGGVVLVPLLVGVMKMGQHKAHGTSLAVVALTAITSALSYSTHGYVDWRLAAVIAVTAMVGAIAGARLCLSIPAHQLRLLFAVLLMGVGLLMLFGGGTH